MRRTAFYSRSPRASSDAERPDADPQGVPASADGTPPEGAPTKERWQPGPRAFGVLLVLFVALGAGGIALWPRQAAQTLTQKDIDAAVLRTLQTTSLPSPAARAADTVRPSIVRVVGYGPERASPEAKTEKRQGCRLRHGVRRHDGMSGAAIRYFCRGFGDGSPRPMRNTT